MVSASTAAAARAQLDATRTQAQLLLQQRVQVETAIATLVGTLPLFSIAPRVVPINAPALPTGLPSDVLQRPDVASAERAMAAANAQIGVARAAYFPRITLSPDIGWDATRFAGLFTVPRCQGRSGSLSQPLLRRQLKVGVDFAQAGYVAAQASYRQTVLTAFQEVQNAVTGCRCSPTPQQAAAAVDDARKLCRSRRIATRAA